MATMCRSFLISCRKKLLYKAINTRVTSYAVSQYQISNLSTHYSHNKIKSHSWLSSPCIHDVISSPVLIQYSYHQPVRFMSSDGKKRGFFQDLITNIKDELARNKEMKESLSKFKQETSKLEQSEAIQKARQKFDSIEAETKKGSTVIKKTLEDIKGKFSETMEEVQKTEFIKKGRDITDELGKTAGKAADSISKKGQDIGQSSTFQSISQGVKAVKEEFDEVTLARAKTYKAPVKLRKRTDRSGYSKDDKQFEADDESTGMVLHKDSKFYQSWQNFKDNNQYVNKMFDLKTRYDESDHMLVRVTRGFTDKVGQVFGGMFSKTEMSEVLTEICKIDPSFEKERFVRMCEKEIIPNVLEAIIRGDLEVLKDWCHEAPYNTLAHPIKAAKQAGYRFDSKILDISNVDVVAGKIMDQGPVLIISFNSQQILAVRNSKGEVKEGDPVIQYPEFST
ncbi:mitochondrial import inner membrane translocase subunit TIM44 [Patella vulgata]|uniref:mitochondrial import inner membrane translocase subunit TIM44 n=1 Tax=Patella vulgata TaxID=6465 RepID=UPI0021801D0F|nr:mitochondrial import inner membrane translocase subunit TIM44 [Patella vulgata]